MAVRHYAHQYTVQLTEKKITDGNVSSESSDVDDYYPLIHHSVSGSTLDRNARRRVMEANWDEVNRKSFEYGDNFIPIRELQLPLVLRHRRYKE
ncbi:hypothetical protein EAI_04486 [Harpegnathos saltator]|uniref:Uncharacterized protein n=1 Tax=Harpegnathos saltator TaxID=610380 RepID=E2C5M7_HARSA|nr:hypothetical protein EAI_04486 [Harpegnathos saltator]